MYSNKRINILFIFFLLYFFCFAQPSFSARRSIAPTAGTMSLATYLSNIDANTIELYRLIFPSEPGFTGVTAAILTSGLVPDARISGTFVRVTDMNAALSLKMTTSDYVSAGRILASRMPADYVSISSMNTAISASLVPYMKTVDYVSGGRLLSSVMPEVGTFTRLMIAGTDGTTGLFWDNVNTTDPTLTNYAIYPKADGIYVRVNGVNTKIGSGTGDGSVSVNGTTVTNPNFNSVGGDVTFNVNGSTITGNINNAGVGSFAASSIVDSNEDVNLYDSDTTMMTTKAITTYVQYQINMAFGGAGMTVGTYITPPDTPITINTTSYTLSGQVFEQVTPTVTVSVNGGAPINATITGTSSPWTWTRSVTLNVGVNTVQATVVAGSHTLVMPIATINVVL